MPSIEPFRLLDLPREVRDDIYRGMLCNWQEAGIGNVQARGTVRLDPMRRRISPNILLANKQIYQEAKQVLLKANQFVHIEMVFRNNFIIEAIFPPSEVPVVAVGGLDVSRFRDLVVMTYSVDFAKDPRTRVQKVERIDVIILHRDLEHFCEGFVRLDTFTRPHAGQSKHQVTIHDPFANTLSPDFLNHMNQQRLLKPFTKRFHGVDHFKIEGNVQPDLAKTVVAEVWKELPFVYPEPFLGELLRRKELGNQAFRDGNNDEARKAWASVKFALIQVRNRRGWPHFKKVGGKEFIDRITELGFQAHANEAQVHLLDMRTACLQLQIYEGQSFHGSTQAEDKVRHIRGRLEELAGRLDHACSEADSISTLLGTDWTPSKEQLAKICYCRAQGFRLAEQDSQFALHMINHAVELLPDDQLIQSEAQQIRVWRARVRGGRWLWIDSLCIIQDSTKDWQREAVMMYSVYKGALLNISADDSNDARHSCFRARDPLAVLPMRLRLPGPAPAQEQHQQPAEDEDKDYGIPGQRYWLTPDSTGLFEAATKTPLARRAWVFQERQLSRRVLHFTSRELVWECCAEGPYFACETFPGGAPLSQLFGGRPKYQGQGLSGGGTGEVYDTWDMLCRSYSEKKLSHVGDKAVALSGLAQEFQALLPEDSDAAGMWESLFPQSLLWKSAEPSGRVDSKGYVALSWSWLSIDGPILEFPPRGTSLPVVELLGVTQEPMIPSEPTASLRDVYIDVRCYLRHVEIRPDYEVKPWYMLSVGGGKNHKLVVGDGETEVGSFDPPGHSNTFTYSLDIPSTEDSGPVSVSAYFLPVSLDGPGESSSTSINGLLVEPVDSDLTAFRRLGIMSCCGLHCLPILYKARKVRDKIEDNAESTGQWDKLRSLLGESYKSRESIKGKHRRHKGAEHGSSAPLDDNSALSSSKLSTENDQPGDNSTVSIDAVKTGSHANDAGCKNDGDQTTMIPTGAEVDKMGEGMRNLHVSGEEEDNNIANPPAPTINWEAFEALDRIYAADAAFTGSNLEQHFERLVARHIRLI